MRRGTKRGHTYHLLAAQRGPVKVFEPFLVTLTDKSEIFPGFQHAGTEFACALEAASPDLAHQVARIRDGRDVPEAVTSKHLVLSGWLPPVWKQQAGILDSGGNRHGDGEVSHR